MNTSNLRMLIREMVKETAESSRWSYEAAQERYAELLAKHLQSVRPSDYRGHPSGLRAYMVQRLKAGYDALDRGMLETGWTTGQITDEAERRTRERIRSLPR